MGLIAVSATPSGALTNPERPYGAGQWDRVVWRDYCDLRGRPPTTTEIRDEVAAITKNIVINGADAGPPSEDLLRGRRAMRAQDAVSLANDNFLGGVVRLYFAYFDRDPDVGGLSYWLARRKAGAVSGVAQVSASFARSSEFVNLFGFGSNEHFVRLVYLHVMDREPDAAGLKYWVPRLDQGLAKSAMMLQFSESQENKARTARRGQTHIEYQLMLGRAAVPADFAAVTAITGPEADHFTWFRVNYFHIIDSSEYAVRTKRPYNYCRR